MVRGATHPTKGEKMELNKINALINRIKRAVAELEEHDSEIKVKLEITLPTIRIDNE